MYWWHKAALLLENRLTKRFGFITTNSIVQDYSRPVMEFHTDLERRKCKLLFAVTNHPWVDTEDGAAVDVAMTVCAPWDDTSPCRITNVLRIREEYTFTETFVDTINPTLRDIPNVFEARGLVANKGLCFQGVVPANEGFKIASDPRPFGGRSSIVRRYMIGDDLTERLSHTFIIDFFGHSEEEARRTNTAAFQKVLTEVKPDRDTNDRKAYRDRWWLFAEPRPSLRDGLAGLRRFIATPYTAQHRPFLFLESDLLPDAMIYSIASDDAFVLGVLSSRIHFTWCRFAGGTLQDRPRYNSNRTFFPFPFPVATEKQRAAIRSLAEELDVLRKDVIAKRDFLTMTGLYNVREKLLRGEELTDDDRIVYEEGRVGVIHELHNRIDAAVAEAYGWPADLADQEILERLVALNKERAAEEATGLVRWLRPEYQVGRVAVKAGGEQIEAEMDEPIVLPDLPKEADDLAAELLVALRAEGRPVDPSSIALRFKDGKNKRARDRIEQTLRVLSVAGSVQKTDAGWFAPRRAT